MTDDKPRTPDQLPASFDELMDMAKPNEKPLTPDELHKLLDELLTTAGAGGKLDPKDFWGFVSALAYNRGIDEKLHRVGLDAGAGVPPSPASSLNERRKRAYAIAVLRQLLCDFGATPIVPGNFPSEVLVSDLTNMLGGPGGMGSSAPLILKSNRQGLSDIRRYARIKVVGVLFYRATLGGVSAKSLWHELFPGKDDSTWFRWLSTAGGRHGATVAQAEKDAQEGQGDSPFDVDDNELKKLISKCGLAPRGTRKK